jgi:hypothetical protein
MMEGCMTGGSEEEGARIEPISLATDQHLD